MSSFSRHALDMSGDIGRCRQRWVWSSWICHQEWESYWYFFVSITILFTFWVTHKLCWHLLQYRFWIKNVNIIVAITKKITINFSPLSITTKYPNVHTKDKQLCSIFTFIMWIPLQRVPLHHNSIPIMNPSQ